MAYGQLSGLPGAGWVYACIPWALVSGSESKLITRKLKTPAKMVSADTFIAGDAGSVYPIYSF